MSSHGDVRALRPPGSPPARRAPRPRAAAGPGAGARAASTTPAAGPGYLRVRLEPRRPEGWAPGRPESRGPAILRSMLLADGLAVVPGDTRIPEGGEVEVILLLSDAAANLAMIESSYRLSSSLNCYSPIADRFDAMRSTEIPWRCVSPRCVGVGGRPRPLAGSRPGRDRSRAPDRPRRADPVRGAGGGADPRGTRSPDGARSLHPVHRGDDRPRSGAGQGEVPVLARTTGVPGRPTRCDREPGGLVKAVAVCSRHGEFRAIPRGPRRRGRMQHAARARSPRPRRQPRAAACPGPSRRGSRSRSGPG